MTTVDWRALQAAASLAPAAPRRSLIVAGSDVGSIDSGLAELLLGAGLPLRESVGGAITVDGAADASLALVAHWLHDHGHAGRWRDELLPVCDDSQRCIARVERAAVRPLGIATHAVHLVGWAEGAAEGSQWLQQRAFDKATDAGLWDTMVGGLMAAGESAGQALERECWEEAGLHVADLGTVRHAGLVTVRRPVQDSGTGGYMVEHIRAVHCTVARGLVPCNRDGEVERFECVRASEVDARIAAGAVTLEAALVIERCRAALSTRD
jgi:8-oxo-dGTP pyrophosphatase MutT (NUDIX family)